MPEIIKRIFTSLVLLSLFLLSLFNKLVLIISLFLVMTEIFYEFFIMLKNIFKRNTDKLKLYLILLISNFYLILLGILIYYCLNSSVENKSNLLIVVLICISSDIGGYIFGNLFKGKRLTKISPNKTYSGAVGSFLLSLIIIQIYFSYYLSLKDLIFITLIISLISQIGDIFISFIKRKANFKDTGNILPGHGGLLDRFDGLIFAIPTGILLIYILL